MTREEWVAERGNLASPGVMTNYVEAPRGRMGPRPAAPSEPVSVEKEKPAPRKRQKRTNVADYFSSVVNG